MTDDEKSPEESPQDASGKKSVASKAAIGAVATIGSAAIAAALLYAGKRFAQKAGEKKSQGTVPSGEPPETD